MSWEPPGSGESRRSESRDRTARRDRPSAKLFARLEPEVGLESRKERIVERLGSLEGRGAIAGYEVFAWAKGIRPDGPLAEASHCRTLLEHVRELRQWADDNGVADCGFGVRDITSTLTGEAYDVITLPAVCLAVYDGDDLLEVYPRRDGGTVETVSDGLASLDRRRVPLDG